MGLKNILSSVLLAAPLALAHPGKEEVWQHAAVPMERRSLDHCSKEFNDPEFIRRTVESHGREYMRLRREVGIEPEATRKLRPRDYISVSRIDHKSSKTVSQGMDVSTLFSDAGACMLMPVVDEGPLYVKGEQIRKNIVESEPGIKMTLAIQVVDYRTCQVVPDAYVDIWSSNSTGIYTGVQGYPGMGDPRDAGILKLTALRGVQPTDANGIATFDGILPGHYEGRTTHIHAIVYLGATKQPNNTITGGRAAHVGQIYFDQSLLTTVDKIAPYSTNRGAITQNVNDFLFRSGANGDDPIVRYAFIGNNISQGMFSWIRFGINQQTNRRINPAAYMGPNGGVMNPTGPVAGMTGGGGFGGGFPGGGFGRPTGDENEVEKRQAGAADDECTD